MRFATFTDRDGNPIALRLESVFALDQVDDAHTRIKVSTGFDTYEIAVRGSLSRCLTTIEHAYTPLIATLEKRLTRARGDLRKVRDQYDAESIAHHQTKARYREWAMTRVDGRPVPDFLNDDPPTARSRPALTESNDDEND